MSITVGKASYPGKLKIDNFIKVETFDIVNQNAMRGKLLSSIGISFSAVLFDSSVEQKTSELDRRLGRNATELDLGNSGDSD